MGDNNKLDITSTVLEKGLDSVKEFLQKLIGPTVDEIGLVLSENVRLWRLKNQVRILSKAESYLKSKNINPKKISLKVLLPLLDGASLEEEEELSDKWASLLINYVDPKQNLKSTIFPYLLNQISTLEAMCLEYIDTKWLNRYESIKSEFNISEAELSNLIRLGLIKEVPDLTLDMDNAFEIFEEGPRDRRVLIDSNPNYITTELGKLFLKACKVE